MKIFVLAILGSARVNNTYLTFGIFLCIYKKKYMKSCRRIYCGDSYEIKEINTLHCNLKRKSTQSTLGLTFLLIVCYTCKVTVRVILETGNRQKAFSVLPNYYTRERRVQLVSPFIYWLFSPYLILIFYFHAKF